MPFLFQLFSLKMARAIHNRHWWLHSRLASFSRFADFIHQCDKMQGCSKRTFVHENTKHSHGIVLQGDARVFQCRFLAMLRQGRRSRKRTPQFQVPGDFLEVTVVIALRSQQLMLVAISFGAQMNRSCCILLPCNQEFLCLS